MPDSLPGRAATPVRSVAPSLRLPPCGKAERPRDLDVIDHIEYVHRVRLPLGLYLPAVKVAESHFQLSRPSDAADVLACLCGPSPDQGTWHYETHTRLIGLAAPPDAIFSAFSRRTKYEINRARKRDGVTTSFTRAPNAHDVASFMDYYDAFARTKKRPPIERPYLESLAAAGKLAITVARGPDGRILSTHAYLIGRGRSRLTHSASLFRLECDPEAKTLVARANRLLHWADITAFQALGLDVYNLGGWVVGSSDTALLQINRFKEQFGGYVVREWNSYTACTTRGWSYLTARHLKRRADRR
jgi:hypothetical protein